jgi:glycosyltransferase involved in cell wall biosynthesis
MTPDFNILGLSFILETLLWFKPVWVFAKIYAALLICVVLIDSLITLLYSPSLWTLLILFFSLYRIINLLRLIEGRVLADYLYRVARKTSLYLIAIQILIVALKDISNKVSLSGSFWLYACLGFEIIISLGLLFTTLRHLKTTKPAVIKEAYIDRELPSITVALPARNETLDLQMCLQSLVASDYPKLEIIVLDDCSQNKRTNQIIRSFAQSGVIFIAGKVPPDNWLAKNYAYEQLLEEASGEIIIFCGVDTRFEPQTLRLIVESLLEKKKVMMSLIPKNRVPKLSNLATLLVQPGRYAWEISLPRKFLKRPPILSTCWAAYSDFLRKSGSFKAVSHSTAVESYFAKKAAANNDSYSFMQSASSIGLSSFKSAGEQRATAIRTRYPQTHRRLELVALYTLIEFSALLLPFILMLSSILDNVWPAFFLSLFVSLILLGYYSLVANLTYQKFLFRSLILLPFAAVFDILLVNYSMWQYEFSEVIWKGRNICMPIMRM